MNLEQFHAAAIRNTEKCFYKYGDVPLAIFILLDDKVVMMDKQIENQEEKTLFFDICAGFLNIKKAKYYSLVSSAFFVMTDEDYKNIISSEHPDRKECIITMTYSPTKHLIHTSEIHRNEKIQLEPIFLPEPKDSYNNNMFHCFDDMPKKRVKKILDEFSEILPLIQNVSWYTEFDSDVFIRGSNEQ
jgi:hypothetical protein